MRKSLHNLSLSPPQIAALAAAVALGAVVGHSTKTVSKPLRTLTGTVTVVHDGDSITVVPDTGDRESIRFSDIDAPEVSPLQESGKESRNYLYSRIYGRQVAVEWTERDGRCRIVGRVFLLPERIDINRDLLSAGWAWLYADYSHDPTLPTLQAKAKSAKLGLWSHPDPIPPWDFRKQHRKGE